MIGKDRRAVEIIVQQQTNDAGRVPRREGARQVLTIGCSGATSHEESGHVVLAKVVAQVLGIDYAGRLEDHDGADQAYLVPRDTLDGETFPHLEQSRVSEDRFLGGWVPYPMLATKGIVHPLAPSEAAPCHWPAEFAQRVRDLVLPGYTAFTHDGALAAGQALLPRGSVRIKPLQARGGQGQRVVSDMTVLSRILKELEIGSGLVLEQNLSDVQTYSVGRVRLGDDEFSYTGHQDLTPDNSGRLAYGGSTLRIVRGGFFALSNELSPDAARMVQLAVDFDHLAELLLGLQASRRNYDVISGRYEGGQTTRAVLEQSWRVGGATGAELAAVAAFSTDPALRCVTASTVERYGADAVPPPGATVYFHGVDPVVGPLLKYAIVREAS